MKIVLDVENTTTKLTDKYTDFSPYNPSNKLVSIGWATIGETISDISYLFLYHKELVVPNLPLIAAFKKALAEADTIIAHNAKYDCAWLAEAGFDISGKKIEDTMIREYVMARGRQDISFRLADTAKRYGCSEKGEIFEKYPDMQISEMPIIEVEEYGRGDIQADLEIYQAQRDRLAKPSLIGLTKTIDMMNEFCGVLCQIERNGVKIDERALLEVEKEFTAEVEQLKFDLNVLVKKYMGDTPVNLDSPQQLSEVIYSRHIKDGCEDEWLRVFNIGRDDRNKMLRRPRMNMRDFVDNVKRMTNQTLRTEVRKCLNCTGAGSIRKLRKDGSPFKNTNKCKSCLGAGVIYVELNEIGGLRMKPMNVAYTTISGFSTAQGFLEDLINQATESGKVDAVEFLQKLMRLSSISSHLSNFVGGIKSFKQSDNILHPNFNQCITSTGRLSSTKPNLQNQPREGTFPIRKVFISRFENGVITEVDFSQLEFRGAVHLARCEKGKKDILDGVDIHAQTASIITAAGQPIGRQDAKSRTFKPLYGGTSGTEAERKYYAAFLKEIYTGIYAWHKELQETVISTLTLTIPTGRQFLFPDVERAWHGGATRATQICNFPVQAFATADVVPVSIIRLYGEIEKRDLRSKIVLTVHDSVMVDTHPDEKEIVIELCKNLGKYAEDELKRRYDIDMFVPLTVECKQGHDAMNMKKAA